LKIGAIMNLKMLMT